MFLSVSSQVLVGELAGTKNQILSVHNKIKTSVTIDTKSIIINENTLIDSSLFS